MPNKHIFQDESIQGVVTKRSHQDIGYTKLMTMDMGIIYPSVCDEMLPGDIVDISQSLNIKFQPLVTPVFSRLKVRSDYFFVPNRIVWDKWETFITRGKSGDEIIPMITIKDRLDSLSGSETWTKEAARQFTGLGGLYESFGLPVQAEESGSLGSNNLDMLMGMKGEDILPLDMPFRSYYRIWNEYYRDEDLQDEVDELLSYKLMRISWAKDYFTTARPWQQKGTTPIMPVTGNVTIPLQTVAINTGTSQNPVLYSIQGSYNASVSSAVDITLSRPPSPAPTAGSGFLHVPPLDINLTGLGFTISDLRLCVQLQRWMELNARAGSSRYTEFLRAQYGTYPSDERLDRPEYIGGFTDFITISEVLQTSETTSTSPQANRAATANGISQGYIGRYRVEEHGWLMCMTSVTPLPEYQNQLSKQWTRRSTFDYYFPLFANISEQPVRNYEVFTGVKRMALPVYNYNDVFGFQSPWNEYRTKDNQVTGRFRSPSWDGGLLPQSDSVDLVASIDYWHTARRFDSSNPPKLNGAFLEARPPRDFLAVLTEPAMLVRIDNNIQAFRPLPEFGTPGRLDHFM